MLLWFCTVPATFHCLGRSWRFPVVKSAGFYDAYEYESGVPLAFIQFYGLGLAQKAMLLKKL